MPDSELPRITVGSRGMDSSNLHHSPPPGLRRPGHLASLWHSLAVLLCSLLLAPPAWSELQFDVFVGFDDRVREGSWFPIAFEIFNDGPSIEGQVVVGTEGDLNNQRRSIPVELPTATRKRIIAPVFATSDGSPRWEAQLLDAKGNVIAEKSGLQPRITPAAVPILGALPRTFGGLPTLPTPDDPSSDLAPAVARLQTDYLPDNPITLETLTAWYLNSEKATELRPEQIDALLVWLHSGGHLIVGIEQPADVTAVPWLRSLLPFTPESPVTRPSEGSFIRWLVLDTPILPLPSRRPPPLIRSQRPPSSPRPATHSGSAADLKQQPEFDQADITFVTGQLRDGQARLSLDNQPLVISASRGRGLVTVLTFSPEREPFRGWTNRALFWSRILAIPSEHLTDESSRRWTGISLDGLFGAMLDSRQVRKLPVAALLLLLVVYLGVIGPFDQWILKRLGKQMWTWVTFPAYVVLFSALIYFIGYRLRAGDLEWNELQVVDQLPRGEEAALRGRTWVSIYSPANARYHLASSQPYATLRSEFLAGGTVGGNAGRLHLRLAPRGFDADAYVPVWINQLYASDWLQPSPLVLSAQAESRATGLHVVVQNPSTLNLDPVQLVWRQRVYDLGKIPAGQRTELELNGDSGVPLEHLISTLPNALNRARQRRSAFGTSVSGQLDRNLSNVILASFAGSPSRQFDSEGGHFISPPGFDLGQFLKPNDAAIFAWAPGQSVAAPIHRFTPRRLQRDAVLRVVIPVLEPASNR